MEDKKEIPEFEVFKRIENLEERIPKDLTDQDIKDMALIALNSIELSFMVYRTCKGSKISRIMKDSILDTLEQGGLSKGSLNMLDERLTYICDIGGTKEKGGKELKCPKTQNEVTADDCEQCVAYGFCYEWCFDHILWGHTREMPHGKSLFAHEMGKYGESLGQLLSPGVTKEKGWKKLKCPKTQNEVTANDCDQCVDDEVCYEWCFDHIFWLPTKEFPHGKSRFAHEMGKYGESLGQLLSRGGPGTK